MYDFSKLNGLIIEKCGSKRAFGKKIGLSERSIYLKLQNKIEFKPSEIEKACDVLNISKNDISRYFFYKKSSEKQN